MRKSPRLGTLVLGLILVSIAIWRTFACAASPPPGLEALLSAPSSAQAPASTAKPARPRNEAPAPRLALLSASAAVDAEAPLGAFEGRVVSSATGKGIAGARLVLEHAGTTVEVTCGADGAFRFDPKSGGAYAVALVTAEGHFPFAPAWDSSPIVWTARPGARVSGFVLALDPATPFTVTVKGADGQPVAGAEVRVLDTEGDASGAASAASATTWTTDAQGHARAALVLGALLEARHASHAAGRTRVTLSAAASHAVTIRLRNKGDTTFAAADRAIAGRVLDAAGAPVAGARIVASPVAPNRAAENADLHPTGADVTDADGTFRVEGLDPGSYDVVASDDEHAPATAEGVSAGAEDVTLKLGADGRIHGVVRGAPAGKPVAAFSIVVSVTRGPLERAHLATRSFLDAEGRYEIDGLGPGDHEIVAVALGSAPSAPAAVTISDPPGAPVTADLTLAAGAALRGTVLDAATKKPIDAARIALEGALGASADVPLLATATTGPDGTFELRGLAAGVRSLTVTAAAHHGRIVSGILVGAAGTPPPPITVELTPTEKGEEPGLELVGIGAVLTAKDDVLLIGQVLPGGGAAEAGLAPGDAVLAIDGTSVTTLGFEASIGKIRGPEGSTVILTVRKAGTTDPTDVPVPRRRIKT